MSETDLLERVARARAAIATAEQELDVAFKLMKRSSVGDEKIGISDVLGDAFTKLRDAKAALVKIEKQG